MSTTLPAMKARLGNTDYYILSMKAQELTSKVKIPKEIEGWDDLSVEERYQRDINYTRVRRQIAPYLANDQSRFFGAIIVAAINFDKAVSFEPLSDVAKGLPGMYKAAAINMGFLNFTGGEVLVPLDGQHRLKAIEFAITGRDQRGNDIQGINPCNDLANEDVSVIIVRYEPKKARNIFTRVNRYARPTTTGQNIITDDDDIIAVLAREVANDLIGGRLAKYTSNTLRPMDAEFTTLSVIYNCNEFIITNTFPEGKVDKTKLPEKEKQNLYREKVKEVWTLLLDKIQVFSDAINDVEETGDDKRKEIRATNLLSRPVTQECLVRVFLGLISPRNNLSYENACERLNALPWSITESNLKVWQSVLWSGGVEDGKVITKKRNLATTLISYLAGAKFDDEEKKNLLNEYRKQFPEADQKTAKLPELS